MKEARTANSTFAIGGVSCFADSFVVAESFVLRIKFSGKNPAHRKSANRCVSCYDDLTNTNRQMNRLTHFTNKLCTFLTTIVNDRQFIHKTEVNISNGLGVV